MSSWQDYKNNVKPEESIFQFARNGDLESLKFHLNATNVNNQDVKGYSVLTLAAYHGHEECVRMVLELKPDINQIDNSGNTILMGAAFKGSLPIVKLLVEAGAQVDQLNPHGQTSLQFAKMFGRTNIVHYLQSELKKPKSFGLKEQVSSWYSYLFSKN